VKVRPQPRAPLPANEERPNLVAVPAQGSPEGQMFFDAVGDLDEVQFRISSDALSGEEDLLSEDDVDRRIGGEASGEADAEIAVAVTTQPEPEAAVAEIAVARADVAPEAAAEPDAAAEPESEAPSAALIADLAAQPLPYESPQARPVDDPTLQARLARIHLRTGSFTLARTELETLAGRNQLDTAGKLDLAEARWRTGDLRGAGEVANGYLAANGEEVLGFVIAAEAAAMANRLAEADHLVEQAVQRYLSDLDPVFAGIARKAMWSAFVPSPAVAAVLKVPIVVPVVAPPKPAIDQTAVKPVVESVPEPAVAPTVEPAGAEVAVEPAPEPTVEPAVAEVAVEPVTPPTVAPAVAEVAVEPVTPPTVAPAVAEVAVEPAPEPTVAPAVAEVVIEPAPEPTVEPDAEIETESAVAAIAPEDPTAAQADGEVASGRSYLDGNDALLAALHFGVALRLNQTRASIVIEAIGDRQDLPLQLVRAEAVRLLGIAADVAAASQAAAAPTVEPAAPVVESAPEPMVEPEPAQPKAPEPPPIRWD
jgi:hypothetical protein